ncbi:hypothetical protein ALQ20_05417 [Pseudomonas syringae pv. atrofaciens]|nr:hypothetical protein ALQ20_05417 [Pseudomonas syringae pv. atrofaciens]
MIGLLQQVKHGAAGLGDHAFAAALCFLAGGGGLQDAGLLHAQLAFEVQAGLFFFQVSVTGDVLLFQKVFVVTCQLGGDRQSFLQTHDLNTRGLDIGLALLNFGVYQVKATAVLLILALQPALSRQYMHRVGIQYGTGQIPRRFALVDCIEHGGRSGTVDTCSQQITADASDISIRRCGVQLQKQLTGLDGLPVTHMNRFDHRRFTGLNGFGLAAGDDLAAGRGHHINFAQAGPQQSQRGKCHDRPHEDARGWMAGLVLQLQCCGQKLHFMRQALGRIHFSTLTPRLAPHTAVALQQTGRFGVRHGCLPAAGDEGASNDRLDASAIRHECPALQFARDRLQRCGWHRERQTADAR